MEAVQLSANSSLCMGTKRERKALQGGEQEKKKKDAFKLLLRKSAKQALEQSGLFLRKERNNLWDSFPSSMCPTQRIALSSKINMLRKTAVRRHRYSEERQHHDNFSHVQEQVGKPASLSQPTGFSYFLTHGREGKKQHCMGGT